MSPIALLLAAGCAQPLMATVVTDLELSPTASYGWTGTLIIADTEVAAKTDILADWSTLTTDVYGRPFDGDADVVTLYRTTLARADLENRIARGQALAGDFEVLMTVELADDQRSIWMSEFELGGEVLYPDLALLEDPTETWLLGWFDGGDVAMRAVHYLTPTDAATATTVDVVDGQSTLTTTVDLTSAPALAVTGGDAGITVDWSALSVDVHGDPLNSQLIDRVVLARFDVATTADAEPLLDTYDISAAEVYQVEIEVGSTQASLERAETADGTAFTGFSNDGVWVVGLECSFRIGPFYAASVVEAL